MREIVPVEFEYDQIKPEDRKFLKEKVGVIRLLARQCAESVLHIGNHLNEVRERLEYETFSSWVDREFAWDLRHAQRMMMAAKAFKDLMGRQIVSNFDSSALYVLASPSSPPQARTFAIDLAQDGERISHQAAKSIVNTLKKNPEVTQSDVKRYFRERNKVDEDNKPEISDVFEDYKLMWTAFRNLIHNNYSVTITWEPHNIDDNCDETPEDPDTCLRKALFKMDVYNLHASKPKTYASTTYLENLILDATNSHPMRQCTRCLETLKLYENFSAKRGNKFNRSMSCKKCESKRVGNYKKKRRKAAEDHQS